MDQLVVLLCGRTEHVTGAGCTHCVRHEDVTVVGPRDAQTTGGLGGPQKRSGLWRTEKSVAPAGMRNQN
jgi:hypothetical protein